MNTQIKKGLETNPSPLSNNLHYKSNQFSGINKENILNSTENGLIILKYIFDRKGINLEIGKKIKNPFYNDKNPSLFINFVNGNYIFIDFGNTDYKGDVFDFAGYFYNLNPKYNFSEILEKINSDLNLNLQKKQAENPVENFISFKDFTREELSFWNEYGINEEILKKCKINSVDWFKTNGNKKRIQNYNQLIFSCKVGNNSYKIYQPYSEKYKFGWVGNKPQNYIFAYDFLDYSKDTVIITAGEKDALCLISLGYNAICFNSETSGTDSGIINYLKESFENVLVCYDNDETGKRESNKIANKYNLAIVDIAYILYKYFNCKDIADYIFQEIRSESKTDFKELRDAVSHAETTYRAIMKRIPKPFPMLIYNLLPELIQVPLLQYQNFSEKDMMLLSIIVMLSGILPNYFTIYDSKKYESNLFLFVLGKPASGKGNVNDAKIIAQQIHDMKLSESEAGVKLTKKKMLFVPGNSSYASFLSLFIANDDRIVMVETEADVFNDSKKQDWGNYSVALRQSFHHELIAFSRKKDKEYYEIKFPCLTCIMTGTRDQFNRFFISPEDGLFSRFILYNLFGESKWKNVFDNSNKSEHFKELSDWSYKLYNYLLHKKIEFCFDEHQRNLFNNKLGMKLEQYSDIDEEGYLATSIKRLGLIITRIGMVLSILETKDVVGINKITCSDKVFDCLMILIENMIEQIVYCMMKLSNGLKPETMLQLTQSEKLYNNLPDNFDRKMALETGTKLIIKIDYIDKILKNSTLFKKTGRGSYQKIKRSAESAVC